MNEGRCSVLGWLAAACVGDGYAPGCRWGVFDGVFFVLFFFPRDILDEIWD